jgi:hypothetical protein
VHSAGIGDGLALGLALNVAMVGTEKLAVEPMAAGVADREGVDIAMLGCALSEATLARPADGLAVEGAEQAASTRAAAATPAKAAPRAPTRDGCESVVMTTLLT